MHLSKSLYVRGLQCVKSLWLKKYHSNVLAEPDEQTKAIFKAGSRVGELACDLFPGGKKIHYEGTTFDEKITRTRQYVDEGTPYIYEATFMHDGVLVMVDILGVNDDGSVEIYEVKSSTWGPRKKLKDIEHYIHDASIQYYVLTGLGFTVSKCSVVMINSEYVCDGILDLRQLFVPIDVTDEAKELQANIPTYLTVFENVLSDRTHEPDKDIGEHCSKPYKCDAIEHCWYTQRAIPRYSMFNIFNRGRDVYKKQFRLYHEGIVKIEDIPADEINSPKQQIAVDAWVNKATIVDEEAIGDFLDSLRYPIYHLDFETFSDPVPEYANQRPYQQLCFQYSLHIEHDDGKLEHKEFLAQEGTDPREALIQRLIEDIPADGCVLVFNQTFEKGRLKEMAVDFPQYANALMSIHDNVVDLAKPFQDKAYCDYRLEGKHSIKKVLPLLVPEMATAYDDLNLVQNGGDAMSVFPKLSKMDVEERLAYREALLRYCELDTLAMVKVLEKLKESAG